MPFKTFSLDKLNGSKGQTVLEEFEQAIHDLAQGVSDVGYGPQGVATLTLTVKRENELVSITPKITVRAPRPERAGTLVMARDNGELSMLEEEQEEFDFMETKN